MEHTLLINYLWLFIKGTIPSAIRDPCSLVECPFHGKCRMINGKATCRCNLVCNMSTNPVCGSDGKTYGNDCIMKGESCLSQKVIEVKFKGVCGMYFMYFLCFELVVVQVYKGEIFSPKFASLHLLYFHCQ